MKMKKFHLVYDHDGKQVVFGTMSFNGKFVFELKKEVPYEYWERIGIVPVDPKTLKYESPNLYSYLNARLPIHLRKASKKQKLDYICESGLKVPSDNFHFVPA